jgi:hypothetical protein
MPYNYLTAILFKRVPSADSLARLQQLGFSLTHLPRATVKIFWPKL